MTVLSNPDQSTTWVLQVQAENQLQIALVDVAGL